MKQPKPGDIVKIWPYGSIGHNSEECFVILVKTNPDEKTKADNPWLFPTLDYDLLQSNVTNWYPGSYSDQRIRSVHQRGKYSDFNHFIRVIKTLGSPNRVEWEIQ